MLILRGTAVVAAVPLLQKTECTVLNCGTLCGLSSLVDYPMRIFSSNSFIQASAIS